MKKLKELQEKIELLSQLEKTNEVTKTAVENVRGFNIFLEKVTEHFEKRDGLISEEHFEKYLQDAMKEAKNERKG